MRVCMGGSAMGGNKVVVKSRPAAAIPDSDATTSFIFHARGE